MDLRRRGITPTVDAVQGEDNARILELELQDGGKPYRFPENMAVLIRYKKSNGQGKEYDSLEDGTLAWSVKGNRLSVRLIPQMLSFPGWVEMSVSLVAEGAVVKTFPIRLNVAPGAAPQEEDQAEYFRITGFLAAPGNAEKGQYLQVTSVDEEGRVTGIRAVKLALPAGGGDGAQADWDAGENEPGHILNRPFYCETRYETILDQSKMTYNANTGFLLFQAPQCTVGQQYTITVNGTEYLSTAQDLSVFLDESAVGFGDFTSMGEEFNGMAGNGEPFMMAILPSQGLTLLVPLFDCAEVTLSIAGSVEAVHPIPEKYLATVRAQKRYIVNCDTQIASAAAPSPDEVDTGELQAAITVIYQGQEHAAVVTERSSYTLEGITVHVVEFFFADHNHNIRTGRWNHNSVYIDELIYTFANKFQANEAAGTAPWLYAVPSSNSNPVWYSMQNLTLPGITLQSPNGTKFRVTVDNNGNLTATAK